MEVKASDVRIDYYRTKDQKGSFFNTRKGVRMEHLPTGIVVFSEKERSVHKNKDVAFILLSLVAEQFL